jgi:transcriptional regulator with XRE-family HTH domain
MTEQEVFGARLRRRRMMLGWNQQQLAERLGMRAASISRYERGQYRQMTFDQLRHLADVLQTSTDYLLGRSEDPGPIPNRPCPAEGPCPGKLVPSAADHPLTWRRWLWRVYQHMTRPYMASP